jgi:branched-chain amino acid aminotransferase
MQANKEQYVWMDGKLAKESEVRVPVLTHSLQYGSGIFEGLRAYDTGRGAAIFRLQDHVKRFMNTAKIYSMDLGFTAKEISDAIVAVVKKNALSSCYIRPFAFYNDTQIGITPVGKKISVFVAAVPFGAYYGKGEEAGIKCKVSSWHRINSLILPPEAKASGNYINSILASEEARHSGFDEAILTSVSGYIAEGPGENIFFVEDNKLVTPPREADILLGITRDSIIKIAETMGIEVRERNVHKEELYTCDEAFFSGTAAEITPITNIDGAKVGSGKVGIMTSSLSKAYSDIAHGKNKEFEGWLTFV